MKSNHPKGLYVLSLTTVGERFSYYGMRALLSLYIICALFDKDTASQIYGSFTGLVYLTPLLGGYIADRYWGNSRSIITGGFLMAIGHFLLFLSALFVNQSLLSQGGVIDASVNNDTSKILLFAGLAFLVFGNGFFKPAISTMVGDLYEPNDQRKDSAFTIYYMGINLGALIAPLICGIFEGDWSHPNRFMWAFLIASIVMVLSVAMFMYKKKACEREDGRSTTENLHPVHEASEHEITNKEKNISVTKTGLSIVGSFLLVVLFASEATSFNDYISAIVYAVSIVIPILIITDRNLSWKEKSRIGVIYITVAFSIAFWAAYEQAGISLTFLAKEHVDCNLFGWTMPSSWFQSVNPVCVVAFAPVLVLFWGKLAKRGLEPSSVTKQAIGLILLSLGYIVIMFGADDMEASTRISMFWLIALYAIHSLGELALSPIGMSMVNKLSPARFSGLLMGVWFLSSAAANILAGELSTLYPEVGKPAKYIMGFEVSTMNDFFLVFVVMSGLAGILLLCLSPMLKKMMKGIE
ncbi:MAG: peptide MFS transporter [Bacteroidaceae bacterium]|nr:peptide MFS transporter [Bacteroidaceae bacterium]